MGFSLRPIDLAVFEVAQVDLAYRRLLIAQGVFGVLAPVVDGAYDDAMDERLFAGRGEETIDIFLLNAP